NIQTIIDKIAELKNLNPPVIKTLTINVNPPSLGNIDLQVSIDSKKNLTASIDVQSEDLFNALNKNLDSLKNTLQNQGFNISQISLSIKNDGQQSFSQNNQNQQNFNNNFLNFNQGSNNGNSHQQGAFSQTLNQNEQNNKQNVYNIDKKQIISAKARLSASIIDIDA
ncbi:MAG: flagellar hook-length control protein FliK, partial [Candidatus Bathyarchaeales archaeon]